METRRESNEQLIDSDRPWLPSSKPVAVDAAPNRCRDAGEGGLESSSANSSLGSGIGLPVGIREVRYGCAGYGGNVFTATRDGLLEGGLVECR